MLTKAMTLDPMNNEFKSVHSKILYELFDVETAIGYLRKLLEKEPDNPLFIGDIAIYYYRSGQTKEFERYKEKLQNFNVRDTNFYEFMIEASVIEENTDKVIEYSKELIKINPGDLEIMMTLSEYLIDLEKYDDAIEMLNKIKDRLVSYPKVHYNLAKIFIKKN